MFLLRNEERCCYCVSLKAGAALILILGLFSALYKLQSDVYEIHAIGRTLDQLQDRQIMFKHTSNAILEASGWILSLYVVLFVIIPDAVALFGVYSRKSSYLRAIVLVNVSMIMGLIGSLLVIGVIYCVVCANYDNLVKEMSELVSMTKGLEDTHTPCTEEGAQILSLLLNNCGTLFAILSIATLLLYHFTCVIYSYYLKLEAEEKKMEEAPESTLLVTAMKVPELFI